MSRVFLGLLFLVMLQWCAASAFAARPEARGKTIRDLSGSIPLGIFQRSAGSKFFGSLLVSPLEDWSVVRAGITGGRLSGARVVRPAANSTYDSLALQIASDLKLAAHNPRANSRTADSASMHLLIYRIADGVMAVVFAYPDSSAERQIKSSGTIRVSVKTREGRWTEIRPSDTNAARGWSIREPAGRRLRRMDRMPMDVISSPVR